MSEQQNASTSGAQEIFGLPQGCRAVLQKTMADFIFQVLVSKQPQVAAAVGSIDGQTATLVSANDEVVELQLDKAVTLGDGVSYENVAVRLVRGADGLFSFSVSGAAKPDGTPPLKQEFAGLNATREGAFFVLSSGGPRLRFAPTTESVKIEAYTAPFLADVPAMLRGFAPEMVGLFSVTVQA